ncbi:unnamed protein product [Amoebophrya sp. A120]|nr:unnamed protein product [Amoebophrya sp. A120]|eukprot:GSA120T00019410001.1
MISNSITTKSSLRSHYASCFTDVITVLGYKMQQQLRLLLAFCTTDTVLRPVWAIPPLVGSTTGGAGSTLSPVLEGSQCGGTGVDVAQFLVEQLHQKGSFGSTSGSFSIGTKSAGDVSFFSTKLHEEDPDRIQHVRIFFGAAECARYEEPRSTTTSPTEIDGNVARALQSIGRHILRKCVETPPLRQAKPQLRSLQSLPRKVKVPITLVSEEGSSSEDTPAASTINTSTRLIGYFIYSRDKTPLIEKVWPNTIVGDDLIQIHGQRLEKAVAFLRTTTPGRSGSSSSIKTPCIEVHKLEQIENQQAGSWGGAGSSVTTAIPGGDEGDVERTFSNTEWGGASFLPRRSSLALECRLLSTSTTLLGGVDPSLETTTTTTFSAPNKNNLPAARTQGDEYQHATPTASELEVFDPDFGRACLIEGERDEITLLHDLRLQFVHKMQEVVQEPIGIKTKRLAARIASRGSGAASPMSAGDPRQLGVSQPTKIFPHLVRPHNDLHEVKSPPLSNLNLLSDFQDEATQGRSTAGTTATNLPSGSFAGGNFLRLVGQGFQSDDVVEICGRVCETKKTGMNSALTSEFLNVNFLSNNIVQEDSELHNGITSFQSRVCETPEMDLGLTSSSSGGGGVVGSGILGFSGSTTTAGFGSIPSSTFSTAAVSTHFSGSVAAAAATLPGSSTSMDLTHSPGPTAQSTQQIKTLAKTTSISDMPFPDAKTCDIVVKRAATTSTAAPLLPVAVLKNQFEYKSSLTPMLTEMQRISNSTLRIKGDAKKLTGDFTRVFWNGVECDNVAKEEDGLEEEVEDDTTANHVDAAVSFLQRTSLKKGATAKSKKHKTEKRNQEESQAKKNRRIKHHHSHKKSSHKMNHRGGPQNHSSKMKHKHSIGRILARKFAARLFRKKLQTRFLSAFEALVSDVQREKNHAGAELEEANEDLQDDHRRDRRLQERLKRLLKKRTRRGRAHHHHGHAQKKKHSTTHGTDEDEIPAGSADETSSGSTRINARYVVVKKSKSRTPIEAGSSSSSRPSHGRTRRRKHRKRKNKDQVEIFVTCQDMFAPAGKVRVYEPTIGYAFDGVPNMSVFPEAFHEKEQPKKRPAFLPSSTSASGNEAGRTTYDPLKSYAGERCEVAESDCPPGWACCELEEGESLLRAGRSVTKHCAPSCV